MTNLLIALVIVFGGWWLLRNIASSQPSQVRKLVRRVIGGGLMALAAVLSARGQMQLGAPLFALGLGMFSDVQAMMQGGTFWKKTAGQKSRVTTSVLEMELDHDTGSMDGTVLTGTLRGRKLSSLSLEDVAQLHSQCAATADQSQALLEAWLQRAHPEFRKSTPPPQTAGGRMTREEALAVLGLKGNPALEEVKVAHRNLMKQFHPDRGGTDYIAAKINQAKDTLI